ncbi:lymphocyte antigen 6D-like [Perognathus longimembris pacificus]|uniref:lymphocyte antigen 6D-like n=1 Tax=Perognathus longimembris pacificus TaxID=214514 RepID=UPI002018EA57|nr:lymphocyte antigen 6D-like [Perognathus longimembris pacificus]
MRAQLLWLLPLLLLGCPAQALRCHQCSGKDNCLQPTACQADTRYCLTTWNSPPGQKRTNVIKACAYTCPGVQESLAYSRASCCNSDLCNGAARARLSWGLLALGLCCVYLGR